MRYLGKQSWIYANPDAGIPPRITGDPFENWMRLRLTPSTAQVPWADSASVEPGMRNAAEVAADMLVAGEAASASGWLYENASMIATAYEDGGLEIDLAAWTNGDGTAWARVNTSTYIPPFVTVETDIWIGEPGALEFVSPQNPDSAVYFGYFVDPIIELNPPYWDLGLPLHYYVGAALRHKYLRFRKGWGNTPRGRYFLLHDTGVTTDTSDSCYIDIDI